jgi:hypothetical protein
MSKEFSKIEKYMIASDVVTRDGIGVEIYSGDEMILEVFRDDAKKKNEVTMYRRDLDLDLVEQAIALFRKEIPQEFQD